MLEKRKTHPFEEIGVSLVCMRWTLVNSVTGCKRLRLASDLPAVKQQAGWNRLRFTKWGRKYLPGTAWEDRKLPNKNASHWRCIFYLAILVTPRPDDYVGKIVKGYRRKMWRPGEARRQSIVFASRNPQRNGIRRIPILKLRLAVELLNKEAHHRDVMGFFNLIPGRHSYKILRISNYRDLRPATTSPCRCSYQTAKRFIVLTWLWRHMHLLPSTFDMWQIT